MAERNEKKDVALIVAHPDDETLWSGGTILLFRNYTWFVACLCRKYDADRAPKFKTVLKSLNATGIMGNLDDGKFQRRLDKKAVSNAILDLLPKRNFDLIITHSPFGEYTRHVRHEEIGRAVIALWHSNEIITDELWMFAYEDGNKEYFPKSIPEANLHFELPKNIWAEKYRIITDLYGFESSSFEAKTTPKTESFWKFDTPKASQIWKEREESFRKNK
jgi:LmbE family N-acetylglucosaminyl deacetylase